MVEKSSSSLENNASVLLIEDLLKEGLVLNVFGKIPQDPNIFISLWAKNKPANYLKSFIALASTIAPKTGLTAYVENEYSKLKFNKTAEEQEVLNDEYRKFFSENKCQVVFTDHLFKENAGQDLSSKFATLASKITYADFLKLLNIPKRQTIQDLSVDEIIQALLELTTLEIGNQRHNLMLIGKRSQAMALQYQYISERPICLLVIPNLKSETEIDQYLKKMAEF